MRRYGYKASLNLVTQGNSTKKKSLAKFTDDVKKKNNNYKQTTHPAARETKPQISQHTQHSPQDLPNAFLCQPGVSARSGCSINIRIINSWTRYSMKEQQKTPKTHLGSPQQHREQQNTLYLNVVWRNAGHFTRRSFDADKQTAEPVLSKASKRYAQRNLLRVITKGQAYITWSSSLPRAPPS